MGLIEAFYGYLAKSQDFVSTMAEPFPAAAFSPLSCSISTPAYGYKVQPHPLLSIHAISFFSLAPPSFLVDH